MNGPTSGPAVKPPTQQATSKDASPSEEEKIQEALDELITTTAMNIIAPRIEKRFRQQMNDLINGTDTAEAFIP